MFVFVIVESKSVYVGNVPPSVTESDLENEFKKFGRIRPDGVAIRSRKVCIVIYYCFESILTSGFNIIQNVNLQDSGGYYAFVEFDDIIGVPNALKVSYVYVSYAKHSLSLSQKIYDNLCST